VCGGWGGLALVQGLALQVARRLGGLGRGYDGQVHGRCRVPSGIGTGSWRCQCRCGGFGGADRDPRGVAQGPDRREAQAEPEPESEPETEIGAAALRGCAVERAIGAGAGLGAAVRLYDGPGQRGHDVGLRADADSGSPVTKSVIDIPFSLHLASRSG
jgi:hypothetical protein